jgi:HK97 family phage prohead protease
MEKRVALFEVKAIDGADPHGEFEAILSVPTVDRDGEIVDAHAFEPLPGEIPIHKFHDFSSPVATATPFYDGDVLKARGTFDPDPESQAIRAKVGRSIRYMSVGFMAATRSDQDGVPHITRAELLEASFVSVPSNREAAILAVKALTETVEEKSAIAGHSTGVSTGAWDGPANEARLSNEATATTYRQAHAWQDPDGDPDKKVTYKFIHHEIGDGGRVGAANVTACTTGIGVLNGGRGGAAIPAADRQGVYNHLARHLRDADRTPAELRGVDDADPKSPAATDPEEKAAAPAAANPPADVTVGQAHLAILRAQAELLLAD